jgi:hypothetical protein
MNTMAAWKPGRQEKHIMRRWMRRSLVGLGWALVAALPVGCGVSAGGGPLAGCGT